MRILYDFGGSSRDLRWIPIVTLRNIDRCMIVSFKYCNITSTLTRHLLCVPGKTICLPTTRRETANRCRPTTTKTEKVAAAQAATTTGTTTGSTTTWGSRRRRRAADQKWRWIRHRWPCDPVERNHPGANLSLSAARNDRWIIVSRTLNSVCIHYYCFKCARVSVRVCACAGVYDVSGHALPPSDRILSRDFFYFRPFSRSRRPPLRPTNDTPPRTLIIPFEPPFRNSAIKSPPGLLGSRRVDSSSQSWGFRVIEYHTAHIVFLCRRHDAIPRDDSRRVLCDGNPLGNDARTFYPTMARKCRPK